MIGTTSWAKSTFFSGGWAKAAGGISTITNKAMRDIRVFPGGGSILHGLRDGARGVGGVKLIEDVRCTAHHRVEQALDQLARSTRGVALLHANRKPILLPPDRHDQWGKLLNQVGMGLGELLD